MKSSIKKPSRHYGNGTRCAKEMNSTRTTVAPATSETQRRQSRVAGCHAIGLDRRGLKVYHLQDGRAIGVSYATALPPPGPFTRESEYLDCGLWPIATASDRAKAYAAFPSAQGGFKGPLDDSSRVLTNAEIYQLLYATIRAWNTDLKDEKHAHYVAVDVLTWNEALTHFFNPSSANLRASVLGKLIFDAKPISHLLPEVLVSIVQIDASSARYCMLLSMWHSNRW